MQTFHHMDNLISLPAQYQFVKNARYPEIFTRWDVSHPSSGIIRERDVAEVKGLLAQDPRYFTTLLFHAAEKKMDHVIVLLNECKQLDVKDEVCWLCAAIQGQNLSGVRRMLKSLPMYESLDDFNRIIFYTAQCADADIRMMVSTAFPLQKRRLRITKEEIEYVYTLTITYKRYDMIQWLLTSRLYNIHTILTNRAIEFGDNISFDICRQTDLFSNLLKQNFEHCVLFAYSYGAQHIKNMLSSEERNNINININIAKIGHEVYMWMFDQQLVDPTTVVQVLQKQNTMLWIREERQYRFLYELVCQCIKQRVQKQCLLSHVLGQIIPRHVIHTIINPFVSYGKSI